MDGRWHGAAAGAGAAADDMTCSAAEACAGAEELLPVPQTIRAAGTGALAAAKHVTWPYAINFPVQLAALCH